MARGAGQCEMMNLAAFAERCPYVAEIIDENGDWECRGRGDVAVDVMTIVGCVLRSGPTFSIPGFMSGERG